MIASPKQADSWFICLSSVAKSLIIQWTRIVNKYSSPGGIKIEANEHSCQSLLMHIPTPPTSVNTYPQFEIDSLSLEQWMDNETRVPPVTKFDIVSHQLEQDIEELADTPHDLSTSRLDKVLQDAETVNSQVAQAYSDAFKAMPGDPVQDPVTLSQMFRDGLAQVSPAKMYAVELTPTDLAYFTGNTLTKVEIALGLARQELQGWHLLDLTCATKMEQWDHKINELEIMKKALVQHRYKTEGLSSSTKEKFKQVEELESSLDAVGKFNFVDRFLLIQQQSKMRPTMPTTPVAPAGSRSGPPQFSPREAALGPLGGTAQ